MVVKQKDPNNLDPNKIAIYVRWSTEEQGDGNTLDIQLEACKYYLKSFSWNVNENLIFIDDGYSGGNLDRPAMTKLREAVQNGEIECVVVFKIDRLSRSVIDTVNLVLDEWDGITYLKSAREPLETTTSMGKQFFYILVSFAEYERSVIKERTFGGKLKNAENGKNSGNTYPYGYKKGKEKGVYEIVKEEEIIVKKIFEQYLNGKGMGKIAIDLNTEGIRFRKGKPWNQSTIAHILNNHTYMGVKTFGKLQRNPNYKKREDEPFWIKRTKPTVEIDSKHIPIIIKKEDFIKVQELRIEKKGTSSRVLSSPYIFSGLMKCKNCGHTLTGFRSKNVVQEDTPYYKCQGYINKGKAFCNCGYIRESVLHDEVLEVLKTKFFVKDNNVIDLLAEKHTNEVNIIEQIISNLTNTISELDKEQSELDLKMRRGKIEEINYNRMTRQITIERQDAEEILKQKEVELGKIKVNQPFNVDSVNEFTNALTVWEQLDNGKRNALLRQWIHSIEIFRDKELNEYDILIKYKWDNHVEEENR